MRRNFTETIKTKINVPAGVSQAIFSLHFGTNAAASKNPIANHNREKG
jgi:hypothetical protein